MRKKYKTLLNCIMTISLVAVLGQFGARQPLTAEATSIDEIRQKIEEDQKRINALYTQIMGMEDEQDLIQEEIDDLTAEIQNTMTSIGIKEDEIAAKEEEIAAKEGEITAKKEAIVGKEQQIKETEAEYNAAVVREETQRENIAACTRLIYEAGEQSFFSALLEGKGFADILNRMDYIERMYEYERTLLLAYIDTKEEVHDLWDRLEEEKAGLEEDKKQLEAHREQLGADRELLEADRAELKEQKASLDVMLNRKKQESANYEAELARIRQAAAVAKQLLQQDQQALNRLEEAQKLANATYATTDYTTVVDNASGSILGKQIAKYALQYVGNPYVYGGTSLTNGADCSGFTYRVYSNFNYTLPRTSYQQRSAGTSVSYAEAQPGDLICYEGHVAMYIGSGMIVHASNSKPYPSGGIKVSRAEYKPILAVRRIIQ